MFAILLFFIFAFIFLGMCFQENVRQHRSACLLEWRSSHFWLPRVLQTVVFHLQRRGVFGSSGHRWYSLHGIWYEKESPPSTANRRRLQESPPGNRARDSGLVIVVKVRDLVTGTRAITPYPGSTWKKYLHHRLKQSRL